MTPAVKELLFRDTFTPLRLGGNAAVYSPQGAPSEKTYLLAGGLVPVVADQSGNSNVNGLILNGVAGNYVSVEHNAAYNVGNLDARARFAAVTWTPAADNVLLAKRVVANEIAWVFAVEATTGKLLLYWSPDGTGASAVLVKSTAGVGVSAFGFSWARVTRNATTGDVKFYTSTGGTSWTQLGNTVAGAAGALFANTASITIGQQGYSSVGPSSGIFSNVALLDDIDGASVLAIDFTTQPKTFTTGSGNTFVATSGQTVTIASTGDTGARIGGARDRVQLTVAKQPAFQAYAEGVPYLYLNGAAGSYASTPDAAANRLTTKCGIRLKLRSPDYTPATNQAWVNKWGTGQRSYNLVQLTTGRLRFDISTDGTADDGFSSTESVPFTDSTTGFVGVDFTGNDGAGNRVVTFYTSTDGITWTPLGTAVSKVGTVSLFNSNAQLRVGQRSDAFPEPPATSVMWMELRDGFAGAVLQRFDASSFVSGRTITSSTGEEWTLAGASAIITGRCLYFGGSASYIKAAPYASVQPVSRYEVITPVSWTDTDKLFDGNAANTGAVVQSGTTPAIVLNAGSAVASNTNLTLGVMNVVTAIINGASSRLRVGTNAATTGDAGAGNPGGNTLGAAPDGSVPANMLWAGGIERAAADSAALETRIIRWFKRKLKITAT